MTLIVARKNKFGISLHSDTRLSPARDRHVDGGDRVSESINDLPGALKIFVLSDSLCFAYAGVGEYALGALYEIARVRDFTMEECLSILDQWHTKSKYSPENGGMDEYHTDFILCDHAGRIFKFIGGVCYESNHPVEAIGDRLAVREVIEKGRRFGEILVDAKVSSVGGIEISAGAFPGKPFRYDGWAHVMFLNTKERDATLVAPRTIEQGGCDYQVLPTNYAIPAVAIHFFEPVSVGYLYFPMWNPSPYRFCDVSVAEFRRIIKESTGLGFVGYDSRPTAEKRLRDTGPVLFEGDRGRDAPDRGTYRMELLNYDGDLIDFDWMSVITDADPT